MRTINHRTRQGETGASAVEYGLLVAAITAVIVAVVFALGGATSNSYQHSCQQLTIVASGACN